MVDEKMAGRDNFHNDMSKYLDKKSRSSYRFVNLKKDKGSKASDPDTDDEPEHKTDVIILKEKTKLERVFEKLGTFFAPRPKKEPEEDLDIEGEDVTDKLEDTEDEIVESDEEDDAYIEEPSEERPSFFARLFGTFSGKKAEEISDEELSETDDDGPAKVSLDDMKKVAIFAKDLLKKIPHKEFLELKESGKVEEFKATLRRNGLIRE